MIIDKIEGCTRTLGEAQGYIGLPIRDELVLDSATGQPVNQMSSVWQPSAEEVQQLLNGGQIRLSVFGDTHPPVRLEVVPAGDTHPEPQYPDSFADHPQSLAEHVSDKDQDASKWAPRDALVSVLRDLDRGELPIETIVICYSWPTGPGRTVTSFRQSGESMVKALGTVELARFKMMMRGYGLVIDGD